MSDNKNKTKGPLLLKQQQNKAKAMTPLPYDFDSDVYEVFSNVKNPFLSRILSPESEPAKLKAQQVRAFFQYLQKEPQYQLDFPTKNIPHRRRKIVENTLSPAPKKEYKATPLIKENKQNLRRFIQLFFKIIIQKLDEDPAQLAVIINEIVPLLLEQGLKIKIYDAYRQFPNWESFIATLHRISQDAEIENFELFCSALFGVYSQFA
ncbi:hypothetical protein WDW89_17810 [Deltaproteobacteria bacterium TL4]